MNKHGIRLITAVVTSSMIVTPVLAAPSVDDLKKEKAAKQSEVSSLQSQLTTLMGKVNTLESELIQTGEDITKAQGDLEVAQEKEKEQYAAMKKRIKYMYEAGNDSAFETLVTSEDFTDLLSKAEYVQNVHSYDRKQLQEYVETKQQISDLKDSLEKDQKELESKQVEYEKQGDNLNNLITSKSAEVANLDSEIQAAAEAAARGGRHYARNAREDRELEEIFIRTYGRVERKADRLPKTVTAGKTPKAKKDEEGVQEYLLVDGYNVIFAWDDLKELAKENIEAARNKLMDVLCNYQGFKNYPLILVFDAYKVEGEAMEIFKYHNIHVVYTKEAETADMYIEKVVHEVGRKYHVTVVTSDGVEQVITQGQGGTIISSREFLEEVKIVNRQIQEEWELHKESAKNYLFDHMDRELAGHMEEVRMGRKELGERANDQ